MKTFIKIFCLSFLLIYFLSSHTLVFAQSDTYLKKEKVNEIIDTVFQTLKINYVYPELVKKWELEIRQPDNIK